jgi:hypothetical protein
MSRIGSPSTGSAVARQARLAAPAAAAATLCFSAGGFFAGTTAVAAIAARVALLLRITLARHPWEGWSARAVGRRRRAFQRCDCPTAFDTALDSIDALPARA